MSLDLSFLTRLRPHASPQALSALGALQPLDQAQQSLDAQKTGAGAQVSLSSLTRNDPAPLLEKFEPAKPVLQDALQLNAKLGKDLAAVRTAAEIQPKAVPSNQTDVTPPNDAQIPSRQNRLPSPVTQAPNLQVNTPTTPQAGPLPKHQPGPPKVDAQKKTPVPTPIFPQVTVPDRGNVAGPPPPQTSPVESTAKIPAPVGGPAVAAPPVSPTATGIPRALGSPGTEQALGVQAPPTPSPLNLANPKSTPSVPPVNENQSLSAPKSIGNQATTQPPARKTPTAPPADAPTKAVETPGPLSALAGSPPTGSTTPSTSAPSVTGLGPGTPLGQTAIRLQPAPPSATVPPPPAPSAASVGALAISNIGKTAPIDVKPVSAQPSTINPSTLAASAPPQPHLPAAVSSPPTVPAIENMQAPIAAALPRIQPVETQTPALETATVGKPLARTESVAPVVPAQETLHNSLQTNRQFPSPPNQETSRNLNGTQSARISTTETASTPPANPPPAQVQGLVQSAPVQTAFQSQAPTVPLPAAPQIVSPQVPSTPPLAQAPPVILAKPRPIVNSATLVAPPAPPIQGAVVQPEPVATLSPEFGLANVAPVPIQRVTPFPEPKPFPVKAAPPPAVPLNPFGTQRLVLADSNRVVQAFQKLGIMTGSESLRGEQIPLNRVGGTAVTNLKTAQNTPPKNLETVAGITLNGNNEVQPETVRPQIQLPKTNERISVTIPVTFPVAGPGPAPIAAVSPNPLATSATFLRVRASVQPVFQLLDIVL